jgi:hypothetical protein
MFLFLAFGFLLGVATESTNNFKECKAENFKNPACSTPKKLNDFGK